ERGDTRIIRGGAPRTLGHAEGGHPCPQPVLLREKLRVQRVGTWIAALDIVYSEVVQHAGDGALVTQRKVDARRLGAIAPGGVEQTKPRARYAPPRFEGGSSRRGASAFTMVVWPSDSRPDETVLRRCTL